MAWEAVDPMEESDTDVLLTVHVINLPHKYLS